MFTFANVVKSVRSSVVAAIDSEVVKNTVVKLDSGITISDTLARKYASHAAVKTAEVLKVASAKAAQLSEAVANSPIVQK